MAHELYYDKMLPPEQAGQNIVDALKKAYPSNIFTYEVVEGSVIGERCMITIYVFGQRAESYACHIGKHRTPNDDYFHLVNIDRFLRHLVII